MKVLVIDIGGSNVKFAIPGTKRQARFASGKTLTPKQMLEQVLGTAGGWQYDAVSIGYPGRVVKGKPAAEPPNLGKGWCRFNFAKAFKKPVKVINDAAMQALGRLQGRANALYRAGQRVGVGVDSR